MAMPWEDVGPPAVAPDQAAPPLAEWMKPQPNLPGYVGPDVNAPGGIVAPESPLTRGSQVFGGGVVRGSVGLPGDIAQLAGLGPDIRSTTWLPTSRELESWPSLQATAPRTPGEALLAAGGTGVGGGVTGGALGGALTGLVRGGALADTLAGAVKGGEQGAVSGFGGEAGRQLFPEQPAVGQTIGSLTGLVTGKPIIPAIGKAIGTRYFPEQAGAVQRAADALGMRMSLAGDVTQSAPLQAAQSVLSRLPGGGRIVRAAEDQVNQFGQAVENSAQQIESNARLTAPMTSLQRTGDTVQDQAYDWLKNWQTRQQTAENTLSQFVPDTTRVGLGNTWTALSDLTRMPNMPEVARVMRDPATAPLLTALQKDMPTAGATANTLPWGDIRQWRTQVGQRLNDAALGGDPAQGAWRRLYGALSDDLGAAATGQGPAATQAWNTANQVTRDGALFRDQVLNKIINNRNPAQNTIQAEDAANNVLSGQRLGGSALEDVRREMPQAADALAAWQLRGNARAVASKQLGAGDMISPETFLTKRQVSPEATDALYPPNTQARADLDNLTTVAGAMRKSAQTIANPSGTAQSVTYMTVPQRMWEGAQTGAHLGATVGGPAGYVLGGAVGAASPFGPGWLGGQALARPAMSRWWQQPQLLQAPAAARWGGLAGALVPQVWPGETGR